MEQANEYAYDANGNLTEDLNKNITTIQYNYLNLPSKIIFGDGSTIAYLYGADGTKLRTTHNINGTVTTTDYCDNVIYENDTAIRLLTEAGYVSLNDNKYHYYLQDHQGNNRVVVNQSGTVEETNHYYPFGSVFANTNNVQPHKYNGKELDAKKGLNWYDYGARHYDAVLGRFMTVDPMAEKYYDTAPYAYVGNNPANFVDPDGRMKVIYNPDGSYKETTGNNWFHNTFFGIQQYIDYGNKQVHLSNQEFWDWQRTGEYGSISPTNAVTNLEFKLDEPANGFWDGAAKFILSNAYSLVNSPKVMLTGRTLSGASQTPDERIGSFINVVGTYIPTSKMIKANKASSWYKFKNANKHIPASLKKGVYEMEMRRYKENVKGNKAFQKINGLTEEGSYIYNQNKREEE